MSQTQVVAAIIRRDFKYLLGKRSLNKRSSPGFWNPISGKIELGETEEHAVVRECDEEVGLTVKALKKVAEFDVDEGKARLHWWLVDIIEGKEFLKNDEHSELGWFTVEEMRKLEMIIIENIEIFAKLNLKN